MAFKPEDHFIQLPKRIKNKTTGNWEVIQEDYLEVKWRLVWFRSRFPHGRLITEEICVDLDRVVTVETKAWVNGKQETTTKTGTGYARYRTMAEDGEGGCATGYGTENAAEFPDFVERAETRSVGRALAGLGIGTQFVGEELGERLNPTDAPEVPASVTTANDPRISGSEHIDHGHVIEEPHEVLSRKPLEKLNQQECVFRLHHELKRLTGTGQNPTSKQHRTDVITSVFGTAIDTFAKASPLGKTALQRALHKLEAMQPEQPPADTPTGNHSPVESTIPQEGPSLPPGDEIGGGSFQGQCATLQDGIRCLLPDTHLEAHAFTPEPIVGPPLTIVDGYVSVPDVHVLEIWARMHGQIDCFTEMTAACPREAGEPCITARLGERIIAAVIYRAEHTEVTA